MIRIGDFRLQVIAIGQWSYLPVREAEGQQTRDTRTHRIHTMVLTISISCIISISVNVVDGRCKP